MTIMIIVQSLGLRCTSEIFDRSPSFDQDFFSATAFGYAEVREEQKEICHYRMARHYDMGSPVFDF